MSFSDTSRSAQLPATPPASAPAPPPPPAELVAQRLESVEAGLSRLTGFAAELREHLVQTARPAEHRLVVFTPTEPRQRIQSPRVPSFAVYNPTSIPIYLGIGDLKPGAGSRLISVPAISAVVLPLETDDLRLGVEVADLDGSDAAIHVLLFATVQPFGLWRLA